MSKGRLGMGGRRQQEDAPKNYSIFFSVFLPFFGPFPRHMEVPRRGVQSELKPLAHTQPQQLRIRGSEPPPRPTPKLMATPDPQPSE